MRFSLCSERQSVFVQCSRLSPGIRDVACEVYGSLEARFRVLPLVSLGGDRSLNPERVDQSHVEPLARYLRNCLHRHIVGSVQIARGQPRRA